MLDIRCWLDEIRKSMPSNIHDWLFTGITSALIWFLYQTINEYKTFKRDTESDLRESFKQRKEFEGSLTFLKHKLDAFKDAVSNLNDKIFANSETINAKTEIILDKLNKSDVIFKKAVEVARDLNDKIKDQKLTISELSLRLTAQQKDTEELFDTIETQQKQITSIQQKIGDIILIKTKKD